MNLLAVVIGTIVIIVFSWFFSVKHKRYHGIPRFFAFESIYLLTLLNIRVWFHDPFSFNQVVSWILLILSAYFGLAGFILLKKRGRSSGNLWSHKASALPIAFSYWYGCDDERSNDTCHHTGSNKPSFCLFHCPC
jgi:hypothetical protein